MACGDAIFGRLRKSCRKFRFFFNRRISFFISSEIVAADDRLAAWIRVRLSRPSQHATLVKAQKRPLLEQRTTLRTCIASWVRTLTVATIVKAQNSGPRSRRPGTPRRALQYVGARKDDSQSDSGMPAPQATARDTPPGSAAKKSSQSPTSRRPQVGGAEPGAGSPVRRIRRRLRRRP